MFRDDLIRAEKAARQLTAEEVAANAGVGRNSVLQVLKGQVATMKIETVERIVKSLGYEMSDVFTRAA